MLMYSSFPAIHAGRNHRQASGGGGSWAAPSHRYAVSTPSASDETTWRSIRPKPQHRAGLWQCGLYAAIGFIESWRQSGIVSTGIGKIENPTRQKEDGVDPRSYDSTDQYGSVDKKKAKDAGYRLEVRRVDQERAMC
jgi:hypothetical protein